MTPQYFGRAFQIEGISFDGGVKRYKVNGELYLRHDLLKISDVRRQGQTSAFEDKPEATKQMNRQFARQQKRAKALKDVFVPTTTFYFGDDEAVEAAEAAEEPPAPSAEPVQELPPAPHAADGGVRDAARVREGESELQDVPPAPPNPAELAEQQWREWSLAKLTAKNAVTAADIQLLYDDIRRTGGAFHVARSMRQYLAHETGKDEKLFANSNRFRDLVALREEIKLLRDMSREQIRERVANHPKYFTRN
jgi:hypothetical protein